MKSFEIAGHEIKPGTRAHFELPVARLATQNMVQLPVAVLHGAKPGPRLFVTAAVHGDEVNGTEIARLLIDGTLPHLIAGTLIVLPIVNVLGFIQGDRYLPDRRDLNRMFPGSAQGSLASQLANLVMKEVVRRSTHGVDLHGGSMHRTNLPQIRADLRMEGVPALCEAFGAPLSMHAKQRAGSLRSAAGREGVPVLVYEAGEPMRFERDAIREGLDGVKRLMHHLGMLTQSPPITRPSIVSEESHWVRAARSGIARIFVDPGDEVAKGSLLAEIGDAFGKRASIAKARSAGIVIGRTLNPIVSRGDALIHIASVRPQTAP